MGPEKEGISAGGLTQASLNTIFFSDRPPGIIGEGLAGSGLGESIETEGTTLISWIYISYVFSLKTPHLLGKLMIAIIIRLL